MSFSHPMKPIFFNITNTFLKVVSSLSKNTNNPPPIYIKYNVNNKYVTFLLLSFPLPFISIFYIFLELGESILTTSTFGGFNFFLLKHLILCVFVIFHKFYNKILRQIGAKGFVSYDQTCYVFQL